MIREGLPQAAAEVAEQVAAVQEAVESENLQQIAQREAVMDADGRLNEAFADQFESEFGMRKVDADQYIVFGKWKGSMAKMLLDPRCPLGEQVREAYQDPEQGIDGVQQIFTGLGMVDKLFKPQISQETLDRGAARKREAVEKARKAVESEQSATLADSENQKKNWIGLTKNGQSLTGAEVQTA